MNEEIKKALEALGKSWAEYKEINDARYQEIKDKGFETAETKQKLEKVDQVVADAEDLKERLDAFEAKLNKPGQGGQQSEKEQAVEQHKAAFRKYFTKGVNPNEKAELADLQMKALSVGVDADGGYTVPKIVDQNIIDLLKEISPMREICSVATTAADNFSKVVNLKGTISGWVGETDPRPETAAPTFAEIAAYMGEVYAEPRSTQYMLDDAFFNVEQWLASEVLEEFAFQENDSFLKGDGVKKAKGILDYPTAATADDTRPFGTLEHIVSGAAGAFGATNPEDVLYDLIDSLKEGYLPRAQFAFNRRTLSAIRKLKDTTGRSLLQSDLSAGAPRTVVDYPYKLISGMPNLAADSLSIAFGDFRRGYIIVDRLGTTTLRDPYTTKGYVKFYSTKRVGGMLQNSEAIKLLKFSA